MFHFLSVLSDFAQYEQPGDVGCVTLISRKATFCPADLAGVRFTRYTNKVTARRHGGMHHARRVPA